MGDNVNPTRILVPPPINICMYSAYPWRNVSLLHTTKNQENIVVYIILYSIHAMITLNPGRKGRICLPATKPESSSSIYIIVLLKKTKEEKING